MHKPISHMPAHLPMSVSDFAAFGAPVVAYIRPVSQNGQRAYAVHGADGTPIAVSRSEALAMVTAKHKDMVPVLVH
jgi:hypothetical protein